MSSENGEGEALHCMMCGSEIPCDADRPPSLELSKDDVFYVLECMGVEFTHAAKEKLIENFTREDSLLFFFCPKHHRRIEKTLVIHNGSLQLQMKAAEMKMEAAEMKMEAAAMKMSVMNEARWYAWNAYGGDDPWSGIRDYVLGCESDERTNVAEKQTSEVENHWNSLEPLFVTETFCIDEELIKNALQIASASSSEVLIIEVVENVSEGYLDTEMKDCSAQGYHEDGGDAAKAIDITDLSWNFNGSLTENRNVGEVDPLTTYYPTCDEDSKVTLLVASASTTEKSNADTKSTRKGTRNAVVIPDHINVLNGAHGEPTLFECTICCGKKFKVKANVKYHAYCGSDKPKPFKCEQCSREFITKSHYEYHLRTHTGERPFQCQVCKKCFYQKSKLTRHFRIHTGEKRFKCKDCGRNFAQAQSLMNHRNISPHTRKRFFKSDVCQKTFNSLSLRRVNFTPFSIASSYLIAIRTNEEVTISSINKKPIHFKCGICDRGFRDKRDARRHIMIHSGERPFPCPVCNRDFRRKDNLRRHVKRLHKDFTEKA